MNVKNAKDEIRQRIWNIMLEKKVVRMPLPPHGRIPNFINAEKAAENLRKLKDWKNAEIVKINPDSPQRAVRFNALKDQKIVIMPTPRIKEGFILLDPKKIPKSLYSRISTIKGALEFGEKLKTLEDLSKIENVDLIVEGSVCVNIYGERLGKGEGYGELEFAIFFEIGLIEKDIPIATTVHKIQVLSDRLPQSPYDVPVDYIVTADEIIKTKRSERPCGIIWDLLDERKIKEIPLLGELRKI